MTKIGTVMLALVVSLSISAGPAAAEVKTATICATTYPLYDMAQKIGGEYVTAMYVPDGTIPETDILLCVKDEAEAPADAIVVRAVGGVALIEGDNDVLTIPVNNMLCASYLVDALCALDKEHSDTYQQNLTAFVDEMNEMDQAFRSAASGVAAITCKDGSMAYFAQEYGLKYLKDGDAVVLFTYDHPEKELLGQSYLDLMKMNLKALTGID